MSSQNPNPTVVGASRLLGGQNLQKAVDATERVVQRLSTAISRLVPAIETLTTAGNAYRAGGKATSSWNSASNWKGQNGGGASFGGQVGSFGSGQGQHRAPGPATMFGGGSGGGGQHRGPGNGAATAGFIAGAAVNVGSQLNAKVGQTPEQASMDSRLMLTVGRVYGLGQSVNFKDLYGGQRTAMNTADMVQATQTLATQTGYRIGSGGFNKMRDSVNSTSLINPMISNAQSAAGFTQFQTARGYNMMRAVGINTVEQGGKEKSATQIANEVLRQVDPGGRIRTPDQIAAALYDPMSGLNQTLNNWAINGVINADQMVVIKEQIKGILLARNKGMNAQDLEKTINTANSGGKGAGAAKETLKKMGIGDSVMQSEKDLASEKRDGTVGRLSGFEDGLKKSTDALTNFHILLNAITGAIPGLNWVTGAGRGLGENGILGAVTGILGFGGSGESRMSMSSTGGSLMTSQPHVAGGTGVGGPTPGSGPSTSSAAGASQGGSGGSAPASSGHLSWPARGPLTARWGQKGGRWSSGYHTGLDIGVGTGTAVKAAAAGTVVVAGYHKAYGNQVVIDHGNGIQTQYAHNSKVVVGVGAQVRQGQLISYSGATGNVTGAHLHFEVRINGKDVDPLKYLNGAPLAISSNSLSTSTGSAAGTGDTSNTSSTGSGTQTFGIGFSEAGALSAALSAAQSQGFTGASASGVSSGAPGASGAAPGSTPSGNVPSAPTSVSGNKSIVMQAAAARGWVGKQWDSLYQLVMHESGFRNTAQNPTSTAFGMFQFLNGTWSGVGGKKTSDPRLQTKYGLDYIAQRYHDPIGAWNFWKRNHWYDKGAWNIPQDEQATVHKGEMVIPKPAADQIRAVLMNGNPYGAMGITGKGSGEVKIEFQSGAIQVVLGAGSTPAMATAAGKQIVDAIAADDRIKALMEGRAA